MNIKEQIRDFAIKHGADLIGFTTPEMMLKTPEGHRPQDIFKECKTVISIAKKSLRTVVESDWATSYTKTMFNIYDQLDTLAYGICSFIEAKSYKALPISSNQPYFEYHPEEKIGRGDISHKHAAQAAGLGTIGINSLLITPKYGNRVYLTTILSDLPVEFDNSPEKSICDRCLRCVKACPVNAIEKDGTFHQVRCRSYVTQTLPNDQRVYRCWNCLKVCKKGMKSF